MGIKTLTAAALLAIGMTGALAGGTALAELPPFFSAVDQVYIGNYATQRDCDVEGQNMDAHPGWTHYRCDARDSGSSRTYDLYLTT